MLNGLFVARLHAEADERNESAYGPHRNSTSPSRAPTSHDGHQRQDKVLSVVEAIVACTCSAGDVFGRFIYGLGRGDGGARGESWRCNVARASWQRLGGGYATLESACSQDGADITDILCSASEPTSHGNSVVAFLKLGRGTFDRD